MAGHDMDPPEEVLNPGDLPEDGIGQVAQFESGPPFDRHIFPSYSSIAEYLARKFQHRYISPYGRTTFPSYSSITQFLAEESPEEYAEFCEHLRNSRQVPPPPQPNSRRQVKEESFEKRMKILFEKIENYAEVLQNMSDPTTSPKNTLFVARLSRETNEQTLRQEFSGFGEILKVKLVKDREGNSRKYAFIQFSTQTGLKNALTSAKKIVIDGREVLVDAERGRVEEGWLPRRLTVGMQEKTSKKNKRKKLPKKSKAEDCKKRKSAGKKSKAEDCKKRKIAGKKSKAVNGAAASIHQSASDLPQSRPHKQGSYSNQFANTAGEIVQYQQSAVPKNYLQTVSLNGTHHFHPTSASINQHASDLPQRQPHGQGSYSNQFANTAGETVRHQQSAVSINYLQTVAPNDTHHFHPTLASIHQSASDSPQSQPHEQGSNSNQSANTAGETVRHQQSAGPINYVEIIAPSGTHYFYTEPRNTYDPAYESSHSRTRRRNRTTPSASYHQPSTSSSYQPYSNSSHSYHQIPVVHNQRFQPPSQPPYQNFSYQDPNLQPIMQFVQQNYQPPIVYYPVQQPAPNTSQFYQNHYIQQYNPHWY